MSEHPSLSAADFIAECDWALEKLDKLRKQSWGVPVGVIAGDGILSPHPLPRSGRYEGRELLRLLVHYAVLLGPDVSLPPATMADVDGLKDPLTAIMLVKQLRGWAARLRLAEAALPEPPKQGDSAKPKTKRAGRPRKGESDAEQLIIAALVEHHKYESGLGRRGGGSVGNYDPAKLAALAKGCDRSTVSRFFKAKFGDRGHKGYVAACRGRKIGELLAKWQGELPERTSGLRGDEREDD
jgi:hypothetical protein